MVGRRVREIRERKGMTQEDLGQAIGELLGKPWPRQTVSSAEAGRRAFTAVELVAIASALDVYVGHLFTPSIDQMHSAKIELSPGVELDQENLMRAMVERMDSPVAQETLRQLIKVVKPLANVAAGVQANAEFLLNQLAEASYDPARIVGSHPDHGTGPERPGAAP